MTLSVFKKILAGSALLIALVSGGNAYAAFPDDLDSGVVFIEDAAVPGTSDFVRSFRETAVLDARISGGSVILNYNRKDVWPKGRGSIGTTNLNCCVANAWAFIKVGSTWYGGTWEFLRNGQTTKKLSALRGPSHLKFSPLSNYRAKNGDVIGLMVSGITRNALRFNNVRERSNIVFYRVGGGEVDPSELGFGPEEPEEPEEPMTPAAAPVVSPIIDLLNES